MDSGTTGLAPRSASVTTLTRRRMLQATAGGLGLSLPQFLSFQANASTVEKRPKSCILLYCWGGMSHHEVFDPKPDAPVEIRGTFAPISTATPGIIVGEHIPLISRHTDKLAIIRSMHHDQSAHGRGMYWNMTGHAPPATPAGNISPKPQDWPSLTAMVARFRELQPGIPRAVRIPYPMVDNNTLQAGEYGGWLGVHYDPIVMKTPSGKAWGGVSRSLGAEVLDLGSDTDLDRVAERKSLLGKLESRVGAPNDFGSFDHFRELATDMLLSSGVKHAYDLQREPVKARAAYGDHICGQSMLLARRLIEVGVPIVQVICSAGDLNGGQGDMWDTHGNNFARLKNDLLPPFDRGLSALLTDLDDRGRLDETLVVVLTEF